MTITTSFKRSTMLKGGALVLALGLLAPALADSDATVGPDSYAVDRIEIADFMGTILIEVEGSDETVLTVTGPADKVEDLEISERAGRLSIAGEDLKRKWGDMSSWFNWSGDWDERRLDDYPVITIQTPRGTDLEVDRAAGLIEVGDLQGAVKIGALALDGRIGDVTSAVIRVSGSGDLRIGRIEENAKIGISGSGTVVTKDIGGPTSTSISGSGDIKTGAIDGGLAVTVNGSGDAVFGAVDGPVDITVNGAGDIRIRDGRADPMNVTINGSGDLVFDGVAVDPRIAVNGSGDVVLGGLEGSLRSSGHGDVVVRSPKRKN